MKYIKLWEIWQWLDQEDGSEDERNYRVTIGELLDWAADPEWREDPDSLMDLLMIDGDWPDKQELIGYHEQLKQNSGVEVSVYSQQVDGQIFSEWLLDEIRFGLVSFDWPFDEEDDLGEEAAVEVRRILAGLSGDRVLDSATVVDVVDFVHGEIKRGRSATELTPLGFKNWFALKRLGKN